MLQQHGGSDRIDISLASACRATHLAHGAKSGGGREPLIHETHRKARAFLQLGGDVPDFGGAWRVVAILVERKTDDEAVGLELSASSNHLCDGRALSGAADDEAGGGGDCASRIANGEADSLFAVVDSKSARRSEGLNAG
jgi:hypothetical protein